MSRLRNTDGSSANTTSGGEPVRDSDPLGKTILLLIILSIFDLVVEGFDLVATVMYVAERF